MADYTLDDLISYGNSASLAASASMIQPDNKGLDAGDTGGQSWESWFQDIGKTLINARVKGSNVTAQVTNTNGKTYADGQPVMQAVQKYGLLAAAILAGLFLVSKLVK